MEPSEKPPSETDVDPYVDPVVEAYKAGIDRTLLVRNLRLSHEERFLQLMELQRFADELRRAGATARAKRR